jgi:hypothetical protein
LEQIEETEERLIKEIEENFSDTEDNASNYSFSEEELPSVDYLVQPIIRAPD